MPSSTRAIGATLGYFPVLLWLSLTLLSPVIHADTIRIAVASNFSDAIKPIARQFEADSGHRVQLIFGSTGKHYAQIVNGAPFDAFFAADSRRPQLLEQQGHGLPGSRFSYAIGKLVLWSPDPDGGEIRQQLASGDFDHLAIANPKLAPYGRAAWQVLESLGQSRSLRPKLVRGENIGQTFHFVSSGNAQLGFIALAQLKHRSSTEHSTESSGGRLWLVDSSLYQPIVQQALLLKDKPAARAFVDYLKSEPVRRIIEQSGYEAP